ncbi:dihydropteroate synthase [Actinomyces bovis]|uniref:dihydropteroate synthase n=1 Tax=Actinomyces bovis TaxID=1658 RepID=UPI001E532616|nr:dihydropteroate synthase [Actinomyces bovis]
MSTNVIAAPTPLPAQLTQASAAGRTLLMGILNVTPDSFSDGGRWATPPAALAHGLELAEQGADIIDVGGESTRPGSQRVTPAEETARVEQVVRGLADAGLVVSIDTIHAETALAAVKAGALIINDVSGGLADPQMHQVVAQTGVVYICQHWRGTPETMDQLTDYPGGVVAGVEAELNQRLAELDAAGVARSQVVLDPGLGFAKTHPQSWELLAATARLQRDLGLPVLIGASRKRFLAAALKAAGTGAPTEPTARDAVTAATTALAAAVGAWAVRVHDVPSNLDAVRTSALWKEHS